MSLVTLMLLSGRGTIFTGESVTLSCHMNSTYRENPAYSWYKDHQKIVEDKWIFSIQNARSEDGGDYTCEISDSDRSDALTLRVSDGHVILHSSPIQVYEGDTLTLTCHHRRGYSVNATIFSNGNRILEQNRAGSVYLRNVNKTATDTYTCRKLFTLSYEEPIKEEDSAVIMVKELFSDPEIKFSPYPVTVGDAVTLTCETRLALPKAHTKLQFAFYRNVLNVQEFGQSSQYCVGSVQPRDSGNYTCAVRTENDTIKKTSRGINMEIRVKDVTASETTFYFKAFLISTVLLALLLILFILLFILRHKLSVLFIKSHRPEPRTVPPGNGHDGDDVCYSYIDVSAMPRGSLAPSAKSYSVLYSAVKCQNTTGPRQEMCN
uniref:Ig-like domain-containing protein n=1 Tax=Leptobrachium leishanense TaxID=445787 RepID=A0A8C5PFP2_9ANUR